MPIVSNPSFHIDAIIRDKGEMQDFDGPLSLILMLLKKNKIEIRDLSISVILDQYLEFLQKMQEMDLEIASEFVQMASQLIYMKTGMLLKTEEEVSELELLMQSLEMLEARNQFQSLKTILPAFKEASEEGFLYFPKPAEAMAMRPAYKLYQNRPVDLLEAFLRMWQKDAGAERPLQERFYAALPRRIVYSTRDKGYEVIEYLKQRPARLKDLYDRCRSESEYVATFLAILELCAVGSIRMLSEEDSVVLSLDENSQDTNIIVGSMEAIDD